MLQMFVPNRVGVYGSQYTQAKNSHNDVIQRIDHVCYKYEMEITKSGLKSLDQPTERCDSSTKHSKTSQCIARYIEDRIGCSMNIQSNSSSTDMTLCTSSSELDLHIVISVERPLLCIFMVHPICSSMYLVIH